MQRQINTLSRTLAIIAAVVIAVVFVLGAVRGQQFSVRAINGLTLIFWHPDWLAPRPAT